MIISKEKLYVLFTMLGDNAGSINGWIDKKGNHHRDCKVGICMSDDEVMSFGKKFILNFQNAYGKIPIPRKSIDKRGYIAGRNTPGREYTTWNITLKSVEIWEDIRMHIELGKYNWKIKDSLMGYLSKECPLDELGYGISGIFDAEGYVSELKKGYYNVQLGSVNLEGLKQIQQLSNRLNIYSRLSKGFQHKTKNRRKLYQLVISNQQNLIQFNKYIQFSIEKKKQRMSNIFNQYNNTNWKKWTSEEDQKLIELFNQGLRDKELSIIFGRNPPAITQRRVNLGLNKLRISTSLINREQLIKDYEQFKSIRKVAKKNNISFRTAQKYLYQQARWEKTFDYYKQQNDI